MKLKRVLLDCLVPLASAIASTAVFAFSIWLAPGRDGGPGTAGDWIYASVLAAICLAPGFALDARRRAKALKEEAASARGESESGMRAEREAWREERQGISDSHAYWVHELKTPLTALRLILDGPSAEGSGLSRLAAAEVERLESLMELSLYESRAENFDRDYVVSETNVRRVAAEAAASLAGAFNASGVSFSMEDFSLSVLSDPRWLVFVLRQILLNAVKHSPPGSGVRLGASEDGRGRSEIFIEDRGPGIAPEDLERIFDRGFTGTSSRDAASKGETERRLPSPTGMGLYLSRKLCSKLGHELRAENSPAGGGRFVIAFPPDSGHFDPVGKPKSIGRPKSVGKLTKT